MMCCKVPYIKQLNKPAGLWCSHAVPGKGCGIYPDRPEACQRFYCSWMVDSRFGPEWKPQKSKFVVYTHRGENILNINVDPDYPNAWTKPPFYDQIKKWAVDGAERQRFVFVRIGPRLIAVLPDREVDLGMVDPEDKLVVSRRPGVSGMSYEVEVQARESAIPDSTPGAA